MNWLLFDEGEMLLEGTGTGLAGKENVVLSDCERKLMKTQMQLIEAQQQVIMLQDELKNTNQKKLPSEG